MFHGQVRGSEGAPGATGAFGSGSAAAAAAAWPSGTASWEVMPTPLRRFSLGRYDVSVRYVPAQSGGRVGGDWYDARLGADGSAIVAIGDVSGHGPVAAAGMVRIGNALRGLSFTGQPANTVLGWLNRVVCADEYPERIASAVVCVLDQSRPALRWAQAGHPPPVLVSGGRARLLLRPAGVLLGTMPAAEYGLAHEELTAGDIVFCYTDGLIERRDRGLSEGLIALVNEASACHRESAEEAVAALVGRLEPPGTDDDVCVLAIRVS
jgi:serine phosphatase RsbU (regulator of sigma subunit)